MNNTVTLPAQLELKMNLTQEQFDQLCQDNDNFQFERTVTGGLIIMSPTGGNTSRRNSDLVFQLKLWNQRKKLGVVFDSNGGFRLPKGSDRAPDASWITIEKWNSLTPEQQDQFLPLCPDFVIELRSPSDQLTKIQAKMNEYMDNGAKLGWLIDPQRKIVEVYRPQQPVEILTNPETVSGENVLPDFNLDLSEIF